jgi:RNA polymerase sigma-70 factor (ECF subfamily)
MSSYQQENDHRRFVALFTAHQSAIHAYVRRLVPRRVDACDVMQEVALVLWKKFSQFEADGDFRRWAFGVARFQALAWRRDVARERERLVLSPDTLEFMAKEMASEADQLDLEREAILQHCLGKLKADQRAAVEAMYSGNSVAAELAEGFGRSVTGFYQWIYRIRQTLSKCAQGVAKEGMV